MVAEHRVLPAFDGEVSDIGDLREAASAAERSGLATRSRDPWMIKIRFCESPEGRSDGYTHGASATTLRTSARPAVRIAVSPPSECPTRQVGSWRP